MDKYGFGQAFAEAQAGVAHLTDYAGMTAEQFDLLLFTKTQLAESSADFRRTRKLFDAYHGPRLDPAQWTDRRTGTLSFPTHA